MKTIHKITSILLALAIFNIVVSTAVHEVFEHHLKVHTCINKDITHFHKFELQHQDLICSFNFSSSFISSVKSVNTNLFQQLNYQLTKSIFHLIENLYFNTFLLRGPPSIK